MKIKTDKSDTQKFLNTFQHLDNFFAWQYHSETEREVKWELYSHDEEKWWGDFPRENPSYKLSAHTFLEWAIGPFEKYGGNPVLQPGPGGWDLGRGHTQKLD